MTATMDPGSALCHCLGPEVARMRNRVLSVVGTTFVVAVALSLTAEHLDQTELRAVCIVFVTLVAWQLVRAWADQPPRGP
jgi:hypothetical protein